MTKSILLENKATPSKTKIMVDDYYSISDEMEYFLLKTIPTFALDYLFKKIVDSDEAQPYLKDRDEFKRREFDVNSKFHFTSDMVNRVLYVKALTESIKTGVTRLDAVESKEFDTLDIRPVLYELVSFTLRNSFTEKEFDILFTKGHLIPTNYRNFSVKGFYRYLSWYSKGGLTEYTKDIHAEVYKIDLDNSYSTIKESLTSVTLK